MGGGSECVYQNCVSLLLISVIINLDACILLLSFLCPSLMHMVHSSIGLGAEGDSSYDGFLQDQVGPICWLVLCSPYTCTCIVFMPVASAKAKAGAHRDHLVLASNARQPEI